MIRINLLPPELRPKKQRTVVHLPLKQIGVGAGALALLVTVLLPLNNALRSGSINRMKTELEHMGPELNKAAELQATFQRLKRQTEALQWVTTSKSHWAPRLNMLSDAVTPQIWLTQLEYAPEQGLLRVRGNALVSSGEDRSGQVSKFLQLLKEQPGFSDLFRDVELESVEHHYIQNEEVVNFVLLLRPTG